MTLALFDLDNTLLNGDSDHAFGEFLCSQGIVDTEAFKRTNDQFYIDYQQGALDIAAYVKFALAPIIKLSAEQRTRLHDTFMQQIIEPMILPQGIALLDEHRQQGHTLVIITATNRFVTGPIAQRLGVENLIATEPEIINGEYTGNHRGTPCFQAGKITRLNEWLAGQQETLAGSYFYSDSANDIPLLEQVEHPIAVDPCPRLESYAKDHNIPVMSLRD